MCVSITFVRKQLTHKRKPAVLGICVPLGSPSKKTVHVGLRCGCRAGRNFQRKSLELCYPTDRYKCTSSAHALHGSLVRHSWCQSVLIIPLDQAIHPLVRCKNQNSIRLAAPGGGFSTAKSEITLSNGQIQVRKQHTCIVWITDTPSIV